MKNKISIIIPVYNEEKNIPLVYNAVKKVFEKINYEPEIIFVDDGSTDKSVSVIRKIADKDSSISYLGFTKNFGKEIAMTAGLHHSTGESVIMIDADLQHPVELIPEFITKWENGAEVVIGVRKENKNYGLIKKIGSIVYYKLMKMISKTEMVPRETDFRLVDKTVIEAFKNFTEHQRNTRALIDWLGFRREYIEFEINERANGNATYSLTKLFRLAMHSFVSHSFFPLRIAGYLGVIITFFSGLLGIIVFFEHYIFSNGFNWSVSGSAQPVIMVMDMLDQKLEQRLIQC